MMMTWGLFIVIAIVTFIIWSEIHAVREEIHQSNDYNEALHANMRLIYESLLRIEDRT